MGTPARNIAVIGCGYWGQNIVRSASDAGILCAVSDTDHARAESFAQKYNVRALRFEDVLTDNTIAGVMLAVPAPLHAKMAIAALGAGKHVFVEKPIALSISDAEAMVREADRANRILMVGHLLHYHPAFIALSDTVKSGALGSLRHIHSSRLNFGKIRTEENAFWSFAPHDVSMMLALAGREPQKTSATYSAGLPQSPLASTAHADFDFGQGLTGHIHVSWFNPFKEQRLTVVGTEAMAVFDDTQGWDKKLTLYKNTVVFENGRPELNKGEVQAVPLQQSEPLKDECLHFAMCVASGTTPRTDGHEGLRVLKAMHACDEAARNAE